MTYPSRLLRNPAMTPPRPFGRVKKASSPRPTHPQRWLESRPVAAALHDAAVMDWDGMT